VGRRQTYQIPNDFYTRLLAQEVIADLRRLKGGKQLDRMSTVRALKTALERVPNYSVLRLDITKFFESIPHMKLEEKISRESSLSATTQDLVALLLKEYRKVNTHGTKKVGVPQGVNFSSALAEAYMHDFDTRWSEHPGVAFYCRYVDDIIIIVDPDGKDALKLAVQMEKQIIRDLGRLGLTINKKKTDRIDVCTNNSDEQNWQFNYLGYSYLIRNSETPPIVVKLTPERLTRIKERIRLSFKSWRRSTRKAQKNNDRQKSLDAIKSSNALLLKRLRFLAGNTKIPSSQGTVSVGIYFSNSAITSTDQIQTLDSYLEYLLSENSELVQSFFTSTKQRQRLDNISFIEGFESKKFQILKPGEVKEISKCWKEKVK